MAYLDDLVTIRENLTTELKNETGRRVALTAAGKPPPTTYSWGGRSVSWNDYLKTLLGEIKEVQALIAAEDLFQINERGYT